MSPQFDSRPLVIFDLDGTLEDSRPEIFASYRYAASSLGLPVPSDETLSHHLCGALPDNVRELFGPGRRDAESLYRQYWRAHGGEARLFPGVREALLSLSADCGLAAATMKLQPIAEETLRAAGILPLFGGVRGADAEGRVTKADMIRSLIHGYEKAVMVGDCAQDMRAAEAAGVPFVAAAYGYGLPVERCVKEGIPYAASPDDVPGKVREVLGI